MSPTASVDNKLTPVALHGKDTDWRKVGVDSTDRLRVSLYGRSAAAGDTSLAVGYASSLRVVHATETFSTSDAQPSSIIVPVVGSGNHVWQLSSSWLFNGSTWDRARGNVELTLLASAARTATTVSADQTNYNARGAVIFFDITAVPGVDTVTLSVEGKDPTSGKYFPLLDGGAQSATGRFLYAVYPGVADTEAKFDAFEEMPLPRVWRVKVTHSGTGSFTYSVGACMIW